MSGSVLDPGGQHRTEIPGKRAHQSLVAQSVVVSWERARNAALGPQRGADQAHSGGHCSRMKGGCREESGLGPHLELHRHLNILLINSLMSQPWESRRRA